MLLGRTRSGNDSPTEFQQYSRRKKGIVFTQIHPASIMISGNHTMITFSSARTGRDPRRVQMKRRVAPQRQWAYPLFIIRYVEFVVSKQSNIPPCILREVSWLLDVPVGANVRCPTSPACKEAEPLGMHSPARIPTIIAQAASRSAPTNSDWKCYRLTWQV